MKEILLKATALSIREENRMGACDLHFTLHCGEITALVGEQDSGRHALFACLNGEAAIESGTLECAGGAEEFLRKKVYAADDFAPSSAEWGRQGVTLAEALFLMRRDGCRHLLWDQKRRAADARRLLDIVGIRRDAGENIGQIGPMERFLLHVAGAIDADAGLMTIEEDFEGYSLPELRQLAQSLREIRRRTGLSILLNTNGLRALELLADQVLLFRSRHIVKKLRGGQILPQEILRFEERAFPARPAECAPSRRQSAFSEPLFEARGWTARDRRIPIRLYPGEVLHIVDYNTAEKQALFQILSGQRTQPGVALLYEGRQLPPGWEREKERYRIAAIRHIGKRGLFPQMSPAQNLIFPSLRRFCGPFGLLPPRGIERTVLQEWEGGPGGAEQERLTQAQAISLQMESWMLARMRVLLLFESFLHIDNQGRAVLQEALLRFRAQGGAALVLSSSQTAYLGLSAKEAASGRGLVWYDRMLVIREEGFDGA